MKQLQQITFTTLMALGLSACGGGGSDAKEETPTEIVHNGTTYGFVTSPFTDKVWLDRNLGAARVCEQLDDEACFGDYYQWGRNFDGHQDSTSGITIVQATTINGREPDFIIKNEDWVSTDSTGSERTINWSKTDGSSVCPVDFRVATLSEFQAELLGTGANAQNNLDAFNTFLKLPSSGERSFSTAGLVDKGLKGRLWANTRNGARTGIVFYDSGLLNLLSELRSQGYPVRCIKD